MMSNGGNDSFFYSASCNEAWCADMINRCGGEAPHARFNGSADCYMFMRVCAVWCNFECGCGVMVADFGDW